MEKSIKRIFLNYNIELNNLQEKQFEAYYEFLIEENQKYNLTAITEFNDVIEKHFIDSVIPYKNIPQNAKIIDVGTGAGFPGVPLKILRPDLDVTLIDSLNKRINFLNELIKKLDLKNISAVHTRAEDFCSKNREKFDFSMSRAVARTNTLAEYLLPFVKKGGYALFYKSQDIEEEINEGKFAIKTLGGKIEKIENFEINNNKRALVFVKKISNTPNIYPRGKNLPKTKPLIKK